MPPALATLRTPSSLPDALTGPLFENHWIWWIAAIALGATCLFLARNRNDKRLLRAGQIILVIALIWIFAARSFDTPNERLHNAHADLADAVAKSDVDRILSHLAPNFVAVPFDIRLSDTGKKEIADQLKAFGIKDVMITAYDATRTDLTATTRITMILTPGPYKARFQITWNDLPNQDWKISMATLLNDDGTPMTALPK